ncbi:MAG: biopolymer transport protein ExbB/TolQ [Planctomycetota bacterium]|jgi:biopolymer transport protein ExbB/TolQ
MYISMLCPHCGLNLKITESKVGSLVRCPDCKEKFTCTRPAAGDASATQALDAPSGRLLDSGTDSGLSSPSKSSFEDMPTGTPPRTDVNELLTGLIGAAATVLIFLFVVPPVAETYVGQMFAVGWVPKAIVFLTTWALAMLAFKFVKVRAQRSALLFDVLPREISVAIRPDNALAFRKHIHGLPVKASGSFLVHRVLRSLDHFRTRRSTEEVSNLVSSQGELDALGVDSSYSMLKVLIWAVPILGFIGTVIGIGDSVMSFSDSINAAEGIDVIKNSLGGVTSGLGVAFHTTLIALVMSILLMVPTQWMQKLEDNVLNSVADFCNEELLMRLHTSSEEQPSTGMNAEVAKLFSAHAAEMKEWRKELAGIGAKLSNDVAQGWEDAGTQMQDTFQTQIGLAKGTVEAAFEHDRSQVDEWLGRLETVGSEQTARAETMLTTLHDRAQAQALATAEQTKALTAALQAAQLGAFEQQQAQGEATAAKLEAASASIESVAGAIQRAHTEQQAVQAGQFTDILTQLETKLAAIQERAHDADRARAEELAKLAPTLEAELRQIASGLTSAAEGQAESMRGLTETMGENLREFTIEIDRSGQAHSKRIDQAIGVFKELQTQITTDVPETLHAQARALSKGAQESAKLSERQHDLTVQIEAVMRDQRLPKTLAALQKTLASLEKAAQGQPRRRLFPFMNRNGDDA